MSAETRYFATRRPPHLPGRPSQPRQVERAVERLSLLKRQTAALLVITKHADGAGFCWLKVDSERGDTTFRLEAGCSPATIYRALRELREAEHIESWPLLRGARENDRREHRARQGFELTIFRLGWRLRRAADLREVDVVEHLGLRGPTERAEIRPISLQVRPSEAPNLERARTENGRPLIEEERDHPERELRDEGATNDRLLTALGFHAPNGDGPVDPGEPNEPTLDEALRDPALFEHDIAPFAACVLCEREVRVLASERSHSAPILVCERCGRERQLESPEVLRR